MSRFKAAVLDTSLFRRCYIICLFFCNITMLIVPAYIGLAVMFCWGSFLVIYNDIRFRIKKDGAWFRIEKDRGRSRVCRRNFYAALGRIRCRKRNWKTCRNRQRGAEAAYGLYSHL